MTKSITDDHVSQAHDALTHYIDLELTPVPLAPRTKKALVRWRDGQWNPRVQYPGGRDD